MRLSADAAVIWAVSDLIGRGLGVVAVPAGARAPSAGWHERVTRDLAAAAAWPGGSGVAVACRASGVVVLDCDRRPDGVDGVEVLARLAETAGGPVPTFATSTPRGGTHLYYRCPPHLVVPSSSGPAPRSGPGSTCAPPARGWAGSSWPRAHPVTRSRPTHPWRCCRPGSHCVFAPAGAAARAR